MRHLRLVSRLIFGVAAATAAQAALADVYTARYVDDGAGKRELVSRAVIADDQAAGLAQLDAKGGVEERSFPRYVIEHAPIGKARVVTVRARSEAALEALLAARNVAPLAKDDSKAASDEVVTLVNSGPSANRIDLVFMGDGYTAAERDKFFADINRMVNEMFQGETFHTYLPLFNVHAVFRASSESGIGNGRAKNTAYRLYREGDTLRAIYPGDSAAVRSSCAKAPGCDYPIVIGNDPLYGGLGGEIAISTSSVTSGTMVLRHELGHNFGEVGEEYDAGGHFGANVASDLRSVPWRAWLTDSVADSAAVPAEPMVANYLAWPWENLAGGPFTAKFKSDGNYAWAALRFSTSGAPQHGDIAVTLDGQDVPYDDAGTVDRTFYDLVLDHGFASGAHELTFSENTHDRDNWVSSVTIYEYGDGYHGDNDYIGAYPLFDEGGHLSAYHSNHEACLMRNMRSTRFCAVCKENNWRQFFASAVKLIDDVKVTRDEGGVHVALATQKLGQFREGGPAVAGEALEVKWLKGGTEVPSLNGSADWTLPSADASGTWEVQVRYVTPEVRTDPRGTLTDRKTIRI
jgi:hypothetical protein